MSSWFFGWILSGVRLSIPLIFAAYGGMLSERAGIANIALESYLLSSSFTAAAVMAVTHSFALSILAGVLASAVIGSLFSFFTLIAKADQIITGMAINLLTIGMIPVISKAAFDVSGQTPTLIATDRIVAVWPFVIAAGLTVIGA